MSVYAAAPAEVAPCCSMCNCVAIRRNRNTLYCTLQHVRKFCGWKLGDAYVTLAPTCLMQTRVAVADASVPSQRIVTPNTHKTHDRQQQTASAH